MGNNDNILYWCAMAALPFIAGAIFFGLAIAPHGNKPKYSFAHGYTRIDTMTVQSNGINTAFVVGEDGPEMLVVKFALSDSMAINVMTWRMLDALGAEFDVRRDRASGSAYVLVRKK